LFLRAAGQSVLRATLGQALAAGLIMNDHVFGQLADRLLEQASAASARGRPSSCLTSRDCWVFPVDASSVDRPSPGCGRVPVVDGDRLELRVVVKGFDALLTAIAAFLVPAEGCLHGTGGPIELPDETRDAVTAAKTRQYLALSV